MMIRTLLKKICLFYKNIKGVALLEFALILPTLITLLFGTVEMSNLVYANQKNQSASVIASSLIASLDRLDTTEITNIGNVASNVVDGFAQNGAFGVVVTIIQQSDSSGTACAKSSDDEADKGEDAKSSFPFVVYSQSVGQAGLAKTRFKYDRGAAGSDVDEEYMNRNKIDCNTLDGFTFAGGEQIVIVETGITYEALLGGKVLADVINNTMGISYRSAPTFPRLFKFRLLPDNGLIL